MPTRVRSYSKINLGLAIGPPRPDGFHALATLYQTLALHDFVTVAARPLRNGTRGETRIAIRSNDPRVPTDARNTVWKMAVAALAAAGITAEVTIEIDKRLPIQGGMGAGSANAAAALLGLERELGLTLPPTLRLQIAASVGSDVPLFLLGGSVLGTDRGQIVNPVQSVRLAGRDLIPCVIALPRIGVSTPAAFREWDQRWQQKEPGHLHNVEIRDTVEKLSRAFSSCLSPEHSEIQTRSEQHGASGIFPDSGPQTASQSQSHPENLQGFPSEQRHIASHRGRVELEDDLAGNSLLALVRTGIENDFETVVFPQYPSLREIKRHLMGTTGEPGNAVYAALSGSGSALFGLYRSDQDAEAARQRLQKHGVEAIVTQTIARPLYWSRMFDSSQSDSPEG